MSMQPTVARSKGNGERITMASPKKGAWNRPSKRKPPERLPKSVSRGRGSNRSKQPAEETAQDLPRGDDAVNGEIKDEKAAEHEQSMEQPTPPVRSKRKNCTSPAATAREDDSDHSDAKSLPISLSRKKSRKSVLAEQKDSRQQSEKRDGENETLEELEEKVKGRTRSRCKKVFSSQTRLRSHSSKSHADLRK